MNIKNRILAFLLAALFVLTPFAGCGSPEAETPDATTVTDAPTEDVGTENQTPEEDPVKNLEIDATSLAEYKLVVADAAGVMVKNAATELTATINASLGGGLSLVTDKEAESEKEIIVGMSMARNESHRIYTELRSGEFTITVDGTKIYIVGKNDAATLDAVEYFKANYIDSEAKKIILAEDTEYYESDYLLKQVLIDGVDIEYYTVIIPDNADLLTQYAAENFISYFKLNGGITLKTATDATAVTEYEILIGDTNRTESDVSVTTAEGEYVLYKKDGKVVCQGEGYMVGGGIGAIISKLPTSGHDAVVDITDIKDTPEATVFEFKEARSAILMIGDGMGFNTVDMYKDAKRAEFVAEQLPNRGNVYTGSVTTAQTPTKPTDSAAAGTALSSGYKTVNGYLGVTKSGNARVNVRELAHMMGARTAVLTTDAITGATPSAFLIHHDNRNDTDIIQRRITELRANQEITIYKGSLADSTFRPNVASTLNTLSADGGRFFIMIEEGHIDKRSHSNDAAGCINMVERFNDCIAYVMEFVICHPDTVLIITADHETGGIVKNSNGTYSYTSGDHSIANVPIYAIGEGTEIFNGVETDNTEIPKFIAKIFGAENFGD